MEPVVRRDASCAHHRLTHRPRSRATAIWRIAGKHGHVATVDTSCDAARCTVARLALMTSSAGAVLAIDQGTTGSTCLVVNADGRVTGRGYREITGHYPRPGWVE